MTGPAQTSAQPFAAPKEDEAQLLARDLAYLLEEKGYAELPTMHQKRGMLRLGQGNCLRVISLLEIDRTASEAEQKAGAYTSVRIAAYMQPRQFDDEGRIELFNAICTDREAIKHVQPTAGLKGLPFVPGVIAPGLWSHSLRSLARSMREVEEMQFKTHNPSPVRQRGPAWHST